MWTCPNCNRIFTKTKQPHSCKKVSLESHFVNKPKAKKLFDYLLLHIEQHIGPYKIISLPCCIHLFGTYDFLAALPKKDDIEIRISLNCIVNTPKLIASVPLSSTMFKNCFTITSKKEIDTEFMDWIKQSYHFKDTNKYN